MTRASERGNSVVRAVEQAAALYNVPAYRMQSRVFDIGSKGRVRPMFTGQWRDALGVRHTSGMADLLLTPKLRVIGKDGEAWLATVLWVECKAGAGRQSETQRDFQIHVESCGAFYLLAGDSADQVIQWFKDHGVER